MLNENWSVVGPRYLFLLLLVSSLSPVYLHLFPCVHVQLCTISFIFLFSSLLLLLLQVGIKVTLGLFGVLIVIVAVAASIGLLRYMNIMASLIILEVVPFLVLAVGVDNLFILVHSYEVRQQDCFDTPTCTTQHITLFPVLVLE